MDSVAVAGGEGSSPSLKSPFGCSPFDASGGTSSTLSICLRKLTVDDKVLRDGERPVSGSCRTDSGGAEPAAEKRDSNSTRHQLVSGGFGVHRHIAHLPDACERPSGVLHTPPSLDLLLLLAASLAALRRRYSYKQAGETLSMGELS